MSRSLFICVSFKAIVDVTRVCMVRLSAVALFAVLALFAVHLAVVHSKSNNLQLQQSAWCRQWIDQELRIVVSCLGDSITYGDGSHLFNAPVKVSRAGRGNFPTAMKAFILSALEEKAARLGCSSMPSANQIVVGNYGVPGATLTPGPLQYEQTKEFRSAMTVDAAIAIVMLGTNDSKEWDNATMPYFQRLLKQFIDNLRNRNPSIDVIIMSPPPCYPEPAIFENTATCRAVYSINCSVVRHQVREACRAVCSNHAAAGLTFVDLFGELVHHSHADVEKLEAHFKLGVCSEGLSEFHRKSLSFGITSLFSDGVHPTHLVSDRIARIAVAPVLNLIDRRAHRVART